AAVRQPGQPLRLGGAAGAAGLRRHRLSGRLREDPAGSQPGPDGAAEDAVADPAGAAAGRPPDDDGAVAAILHGDERAVLQELSSGTADRTADAEPLDLAAGVSALPRIPVAGHRRLLELGEPDRWTGRARRGPDDHRRGRDDRAVLHQRPRAVCELPRHRAFAGRRGADGVLRRHDRRVHRLPVVQRPSGRGFHGRRGFAGARRRAGRGGGPDQAGTAAALHRRGVRARNAQRYHSGGQLQEPRQARVPDDADSPSLRKAGLDRIEDYHPLLDRGAGAGAVRADHPQTALSVAAPMDLGNRQFVIFGMGESGVATAEFLARRGARVRGVDRKPLNELRPEHARRLEESRIALAGEDEAALEGVEAILLSPGVPPQLPLIAEARRRGIAVTGELEFCSRFLRGPVLGITGSNGKTTTTALCGHLLQHSGIAVQVGANIGTPLAALLDSSRDDQWNVLELSSFMLELADTLHVRIAAILNITPDHLDRHGTLENYTAAKRRILRHQTLDDFAVLNAANALSWQSAVETAATVFEFSAGGPVRRGFWMDGADLVANAQFWMPRSEVQL